MLGQPRRRGPRVRRSGRVGDVGGQPPALERGHPGQGVEVRGEKRLVDPLPEPRLRRRADQPGQHGVAGVTALLGGGGHRLRRVERGRGVLLGEREPGQEQPSALVEPPLVVEPPGPGSRLGDRQPLGGTSEVTGAEQTVGHVELALGLDLLSVGQLEPGARELLGHRIAEISKQPAAVGVRKTGVPQPRPAPLDLALQQVEQVERVGAAPEQALGVGSHLDRVLDPVALGRAPRLRAERGLERDERVGRPALVHAQDPGPRGQPELRGSTAGLVEHGFGLPQVTVAAVAERDRDQAAAPDRGVGRRSGRGPAQQDRGVEVVPVAGRPTSAARAPRRSRRRPSRAGRPRPRRRGRRASAGPGCAAVAAGRCRGGRWPRPAVARRRAGPTWTARPGPRAPVRRRQAPGRRPPARAGPGRAAARPAATAARSAARRCSQARRGAPGARPRPRAGPARAGTPALPFPLGQERLPDADVELLQHVQRRGPEHRCQQVEVDRGAEHGGRAAGSPRPGRYAAAGRHRLAQRPGDSRRDRRRRTRASSVSSSGLPPLRSSSSAARSAPTSSATSAASRGSRAREVSGSMPAAAGSRSATTTSSGSSRRRRTWASQAQVTGSAPSASSSSSAVPVPAGSDRTASSRCAKTRRLRASAVAPGPGSPPAAAHSSGCHVGEPAGQRVEDRLQRELALPRPGRGARRRRAPSRAAAHRSSSAVLPTPGLAADHRRPALRLATAPARRPARAARRPGRPASPEVPGRRRPGRLLAQQRLVERTGSPGPGRRRAPRRAAHASWRTRPAPTPVARRPRARASGCAARPRRTGRPRSASVACAAASPTWPGGQRRGGRHPAYLRHGGVRCRAGVGRPLRVRLVGQQRARAPARGRPRRRSGHRRVAGVGRRRASRARTWPARRRPTSPRVSA